MRGRSVTVLVALLLALCVAARAVERDLFAVASALSTDDPLSTPSSESLCGERVKKETGVLGGLYYIFYESTRSDPGVAAAMGATPVILWLSGGPGCSGLAGGLFELGPCIFDDESDRISINPFTWTALAHVIFLDQPLGTGFSDPDTDGFWTNEDSVRDMTSFLLEFFEQHPELAVRDLYIFGESYGGRYVPDLAQHLLEEDALRWRPVLKGVGIGNGVVSPRAIVSTYVDFAIENAYGKDLLGEHEDRLRELAGEFAAASERCATASTPSALRGASVSEDCANVGSLFESFSILASWGVTSAGWNSYDMRRECHADDPLGLCYRFSRLEGFVNQEVVLAYFGMSAHRWKLCSTATISGLQKSDFVEESESRVASLLEQGVRVLVYGGDADTAVNWRSQDEWTRQLKWSHQQAFTATPTTLFVVRGYPAGEVRSAHGLSFFKIYNAGHMVPRDQPQAAQEMVRRFLFDSAATRLFT